MITMAFFLIGIFIGVFIGGRLKSPYIFGAGFVAGGIAGLAVAAKTTWGVFYARGDRRESKVLPRMWIRHESEDRQKGEVVHELSELLYADLRKRRGGYRAGPGQNGQGGAGRGSQTRS